MDVTVGIRVCGPLSQESLRFTADVKLITEDYEMFLWSELG